MKHHDFMNMLRAFHDQFGKYMETTVYDDLSIQFLRGWIMATVVEKQMRGMDANPAKVGA